MIDPTNRVVALCAEGMAMEGSPADAMRLFEQAWALRTDDFEAAIAAHFVARHQPTPADTLHWNALAVHHAELVSDGRAAGLARVALPQSRGCAREARRAGRRDDGGEARRRASRSIPAGGYREFVAVGIRRLAERLDVALDVPRAD